MAAAGKAAGTADRPQKQILNAIKISRSASIRDTQKPVTASATSRSDLFLCTHITSSQEVNYMSATKYSKTMFINGVVVGLLITIGSVNSQQQSYQQPYNNQYPNVNQQYLPPQYPAAQTNQATNQYGMFIVKTQNQLKVNAGQYGNTAYGGQPNQYGNILQQQMGGQYGNNVGTRPVCQCAQWDACVNRIELASQTCAYTYVQMHNQIHISIHTTTVHVSVN